jgi:hypothetical protein
MSKYEGHTPGPWRYHHDKYEGDAILASEKPVRWVVRRYEDPDTGHNVVDIPNTMDVMLIADAPKLLRERDELLDALRTAANALDWAERRMACKEYAEVIANDTRNARALIARIEGESE